MYIITFLFTYIQVFMKKKIHYIWHIEFFGLKIKFVKQNELFS